MAKTGEAALRNFGAAIATRQPFLQRLGPVLEDRVGGNAQCILDAEKLAELVQQRQSETSIAAQLDGHARESGLQSRHQPQQHRNNASMTGGIARSQPRRQQASGVTLEDEHGVVHMLAVGPVEDAELLLAMRGIVGGVDIEQDLATLADLLSAEANELIEQSIVQAHQIAGGRRILPATERGLGAERFSQLLIGDDLQGGIMAQTVGVVGIFVAGHDLIDALPQQRQRVMAYPFVIARVAEELRPSRGSDDGVHQKPAAAADRRHW